MIPNYNEHPLKYECLQCATYDSSLRPVHVFEAGLGITRHRPAAKARQRPCVESEAWLSRSQSRRLAVSQQGWKLKAGEALARIVMERFAATINAALSPILKPPFKFSLDDRPCLGWGLAGRNGRSDADHKAGAPSRPGEAIHGTDRNCEP
jgi:hypothetical protein